MNFRMDNKEEKCTHKHSHSPAKHLIHMIICCGLPILIILSLPFVAGFSPAIATVLGFIAPFICPIMMGGMMFMMFGGNKKKHIKEDNMISEKDSRSL